MGDENHVRTLGDYSRPSHERYRNTIELPDGNNVVPLRSDTIWLVKDAPVFISFSLRDQASNWLECLPAGSISTWEDLTTRFLAQFFPPGRTSKIRNDIFMDLEACMVDSFAHEKLPELGLYEGLFNTIVEIGEKVGEELSMSETVIGEGESRDIKWDNPDDRVCGDTKEVEKVEEESEESKEELEEELEEEEEYDLC
ncbi:zinc finger, CCHC-type containing protein [Tanacetum coccineum]